MNPKNLVVGKTYQVTEKVMVCVVDGDNCVLQDQIDLEPGTQLTFVGSGDDGFVFSNGDGTNYRLHQNDLPAIEESK